MPNFYAIDNGIVVNLVFADSKKKAELGTGMTCVLQTEGDDVAIGDLYVDGEFRKPDNGETL